MSYRRIARSDRRARANRVGSGTVHRMNDLKNMTMVGKEVRKILEFLIRLVPLRTLRFGWERAS